jgi:hypothetical protein
MTVIVIKEAIAVIAREISISRGELENSRGGIQAVIQRIKKKGKERERGVEVGTTQIRKVNQGKEAEVIQRKVETLIMTPSIQNRVLVLEIKFPKKRDRINKLRILTSY